MYGTEQDLFLLYNNPWIIFWIFLGVFASLAILLLFKKYNLLAYH